MRQVAENVSGAGASPPPGKADPPAGGGANPLVRPAAEAGAVTGERPRPGPASRLRARWLNLPLRAKGAVVVAIPLGALLLSAGSSILLARENRAAAEAAGPELETPGQVRRLLEGGATAYLTKPLDVSQFLRTVDEALSRSRYRG